MKESDGKVEMNRERKDEEVVCRRNKSDGLYLQRPKGSYRLLQWGGGHEVPCLAEEMLTTVSFWRQGVGFKGVAPGMLTKLQRMTLHPRVYGCTNWI